MKLKLAASSYSTYICKTVLRLSLAGGSPTCSHWLSSHSSQPSSLYSPGPYLLPIPLVLWSTPDRQTSSLHPSVFPQLESKNTTKATADTGMRAEAEWSWTTHSEASQSIRWVSWGVLRFWCIQNYDSDVGMLLFISFKFCSPQRAAQWKTQSIQV